MTHSHVGHCSCMCAAWLIHTDSGTLNWSRIASFHQAPHLQAWPISRVGHDPCMVNLIEKFFTSNIEKLPCFQVCHSFTVAHSVVLWILIEIRTRKEKYSAAETRNATHCNTHWNTLHHTATHYNTLQHTATHCTIFQHTALHWLASRESPSCCGFCFHFISRWWWLLLLSLLEKQCSNRVWTSLVFSYLASHSE